MSRTYKLLLVPALALFIIACNLFTEPINNGGGVPETAQAFASEMPFETLQALATAVPVQTFEALPSAIPEIEQYFNPSGSPVEQWNTIPIMPGATAGQEFSASIYSYTVPAPAADVQNFYNQKLDELGWTSPFGFQVSQEGGIMFYQKEAEFLTITIAPDRGNEDSVDVILQKQ
jgi:hypothetical protein